MVDSTELQNEFKRKSGGEESEIMILDTEYQATVVVAEAGDLRIFS